MVALLLARIVNDDGKRHRRTTVSSDVKQETMPGGWGPAYPVTDMPEAPVKNLTPKKLFFLMGPAIIALGGSIGGGEWLVGPSLFVK